MNLLLTIDFVGKRYSKLPSEIIESGSSIDIQIANLGIRYENYIQKKAKDSSTGDISSEMSEAEMMQRLNTVRGK